jgi:hypothetical protein
MKIGLRTSEIRTLRIENINFHDRTFQVLDSKKLTLFPLPLDVLTLQLIHDLIGMRSKGYVFVHTGTWTRVKADKPLTRAAIWQIIREIAEKADVKGFNPRILRHYFAANWAYVEKKSVIGLQRILRHSNLAVTSVYLSRLIFYEDLQKEYDSVRNEPFQEPEKEFGHGMTEFPLQNQTANSNLAPVNLENTICSVCSNVHLCKFAPLPPCVTSCRFKAVKKEGVVQYY